jgi:hypothetical protein
MRKGDAASRPHVGAGLASELWRICGSVAAARWLLATVAAAVRSLRDERNEDRTVAWAEHFTDAQKQPSTFAAMTDVEAQERVRV